MKPAIEMTKEEREVISDEICNKIAKFSQRLFMRELRRDKMHILLQGEIFERMAIYMLYGSISTLRLVKIDEKYIKERAYGLLDGLFDAGREQYEILK